MEFVGSEGLNGLWRVRIAAASAEMVDGLGEGATEAKVLCFPFLTFITKPYGKSSKRGKTVVPNYPDGWPAV